MIGMWIENMEHNSEVIAKFAHRAYYARREEHRFFGAVRYLYFQRRAHDSRQFKMFVWNHVYDQYK